MVDGTVRAQKTNKIGTGSTEYHTSILAVETSLPATFYLPRQVSSLYIVSTSLFSVETWLAKSIDVCPGQLVGMVQYDTSTTHISMGAAFCFPLSRGHCVTLSIIYTIQSGGIVVSIKMKSKRRIATLTRVMPMYCKCLGGNIRRVSWITASTITMHHHHWQPRHCKSRTVHVHLCLLFCISNNTIKIKGLSRAGFLRRNKRDFPGSPLLVPWPPVSGGIGTRPGQHTYYFLC